MNKYFSLANVLKVIAVLLLFYATSRNQYNYYIFLRWYVFVSCIYFAYKTRFEDNKFWLITFSVISLLFNPIIPVYLNKGIWSLIDIGSGVLIFISMFYSDKRRDKELTR